MTVCIIHRTVVTDLQKNMRVITYKNLKRERQNTCDCKSGSKCDLEIDASKITAS